MMNAELLGFSVIDSGPVGAVHLPYHPGLTVLYGQNGAGKSYVLRGVASALSGIRPAAGRAFVHVRVDDDYKGLDVDEDHSTSSGESLGYNIVSALLGAVESTLENRSWLDDAEVDYRISELAFYSSFSASAASYVHLRIGGDEVHMVSQPRLIAEMLGECRNVALEAVGEGEPAWRMSLSGCADENARDLGDAMSRLATVDALLTSYDESEGSASAVSFALNENTDKIDEDFPECRAFAERFAAEIDRFPADARGWVASLELMLTRKQNQDVYDDDPDLAKEVDAFLASLDIGELTDRLHEMGLQVLLESEIERSGALAPALSTERPAVRLYAAFDPGTAPAWTPMPLIEFGEITGDIGLPRVIGAEGNVVTRITNEIHDHPSVAASIVAEQKKFDDFLIPGVQPKPFQRLGQARELTKALQEAITSVTEPSVRGANSFLESVLSDAPILRASETDLLDTVRGTWLRWEAFDTPSMQWVSIDELSDAQRRWVDIALDYGSIGDDPNGAVLVVDEPERALHRGAIGQLAVRLPEFSADHGIAVVVATHAPEFINSQEAAVHHVTRSADPFGRSRVIPMESATREEIGSAAEALGLTPSDLLQLTRSFILVEGEHDKVVIEALLDDVLREQHGRVIAIRGIDSLTTLLDSEILIPYTSARLVVVLDHISDPTALGAAWDDARKVAKRDPNAAKKVFGGAVAELQRAAKPTKEDAAAVNLAFGLLREGYAARVDLFGFTKPGIEKYLPIRQFTDDPETTWEHLDDEYMAQPLGKRQREGEKDWLRREHGVNITTDTVRAAVSSMDGGDISDEFTDLAQMVRRSGRPATD